jgi:hypothetical protein
MTVPPSTSHLDRLEIGSSTKFVKISTALIAAIRRFPERRRLVGGNPLVVSDLVMNHTLSARGERPRQENVNAAFS